MLMKKRITLLFVLGLSICCKGQPVVGKIDKNYLYDEIVHGYISFYASLASEDITENEFGKGLKQLFHEKATIYNDFKQATWERTYYTSVDEYIKMIFGKTRNKDVMVISIDPNRESILYGHIGNDFYIWLKRGIILQTESSDDTLVHVCRLRASIVGKYNAQKLLIKEVVLVKQLPLDTDGDQVPNKSEEGVIMDGCPEVGGALVNFVNGCPDDDKDGDGVKDFGVKYPDLCPNQYGSKKAQGCPDKDDDGKPDSLDACPDVRGVGKNGCPLPPADRFSISISANLPLLLSQAFSRKTIFNTTSNTLRNDAGFATGYYVDVDMALRYNVTRWWGINAGLFTRKLYFDRDELIAQTASYLNANGVRVDSTSSLSNSYYFFGNLYGALAIGNFRSSRLFFRIEPTLVYTFASTGNRFNMKLNYAGRPAQDIYINLTPKSFIMYGARVSCEGSIIKWLPTLRWFLAGRYLSGKLPFGRDEIRFPNNLGPLKFNDMPLRTIDLSAGIVVVFVKFKDLYPHNPSPKQKL